MINKYFLKQKINELNFIIPFPTVGATCGRPPQTVNFPPQKRPTPTGWVVDLHIIFPVFNVGATIGRPLQSNGIFLNIPSAHPSPICQEVFCVAFFQKSDTASLASPRILSHPQIFIYLLFIKISKSIRCFLATKWRIIPHINRRVATIRHPMQTKRVGNLSTSPVLK